MNIRNLRLQEASRIRNTVQNQIRMIQTIETAGGTANGYRSLGFYQANRNTVGSDSQIIVGSHTGRGNSVS